MNQFIEAHICTCEFLRPIKLDCINIIALWTTVWTTVFFPYLLVQCKKGILIGVRNLSSQLPNTHTHTHCIWKFNGVHSTHCSFMVLKDWVSKRQKERERGKMKTRRERERERLNADFSLMKDFLLGMSVSNGVLGSELGKAFTSAKWVCMCVRLHFHSCRGLLD